MTTYYERTTYTVRGVRVTLDVGYVQAARWLQESLGLDLGSATDKQRPAYLGYKL